MITYLEYLTEKKKSKSEKKDDEEEDKKQNDRGVLHELLVRHHLVKTHGGVAHDFNDGRETAQEAHDRIATKLFGEHFRTHSKYQDMDSKAAHAADFIRHKLVGANWVKGKTRVAWTSKKGDVENITGKKTHQADDPSDLYVSHEGGHLGISLKTVEKKNALAPLSNGGRGDVDKLLWPNGEHNTAHHIEDARARVRVKHKILAGVTSAEHAKTLIKANPALKADEMKERTTALNGIAEEYKNAFEKMRNERSDEFMQTLRKSMRATDTGHAHVRLTSSGTDGDYAHKDEYPVTQHNNVLDSHKHIEVTRAGNSVNFTHVHPTTGVRTKFHTIRLKSEGSAGIFGSTKTSGANNAIAKLKKGEDRKNVPMEGGETVAVSQNEPDPQRPGRSNTLKGSAAAPKRQRTPKPEITPTPKPKTEPKPKVPRKKKATPLISPVVETPTTEKKPGGTHSGKQFYGPHELKVGQ